MTTQVSETLFLLTSTDGEQSLYVDREIIMGRDASCDVVLNKGQASRRHARLIPAEEGVRVEDLGSTNGTYVNGKRISEPTLLKSGDELRTGESRFHLEAPAVEESDPDATLPGGAADATLPDQPPVTSGESSSPAPADPAPAKPEPAPAADADPKAPPSWVLNNQQSVDGTAFISRDMLRDSLANSNDKFAAEESVTEPTLVGNSDPVMGLRFQLIGDGRNKWEIGRSPNADVMLNDDSVSGAHAQILHENGRWKLVDLMSANGTYANGKKCLTGYLASGDIVRFGGVECAFMLPAGMEPAPEPEEEEPESRFRLQFDPASLKTAAIAFGATLAVLVILMLIIG